MKSSSRYASTAPVARKVENLSPSLPTHCEVKGCDTLYAGKNHKGLEVHVCGKADVYVDDFGGIKRGICGAHYLKGLVAAGRHSNQDIVDYEGRIDGSKVEDLQRELTRSGNDYAVHQRLVQP